MKKTTETTKVKKEMEETKKKMDAAEALAVSTWTTQVCFGYCYAALRAARVDSDTGTAVLIRLMNALDEFGPDTAKAVGEWYMSEVCRRAAREDAAALDELLLQKTRAAE